MKSEKQQYHDVLIDRVEKLIEELEIVQQKYRVTIGVDLYWYIQKLQEFKLVREQLSLRQNQLLQDYMESISNQLLLRLDADEQHVAVVNPVIPFKRLAS